MLKTLQRIIKAVNLADSLPSALHIVATNITDILAAQACNVLLKETRPTTTKLNTDTEQAFILRATVGFNPTLVHHMRLTPETGLTGLVAQLSETINVTHIKQHARYQLYPGAGEEAMNSFLGVPIVYQGSTIGILTVLREAEEAFDDTAETFLVTLAAQLSGIIHAGDNTWENPSEDQSAIKERTFSARPVSNGVTLGQLIPIYPHADLESVIDEKTDNIAHDLKLFENALQATQDEVEKLGAGIAANLPASEQALFDVYLRLLKSNSLQQDIIRLIERGKTAQTAIKQVFKKRIAEFETMEDPYLQERATDIKDLGRRLLAQLQNKTPKNIEYPERSILIGETITPNDIAQVPQQKLAGIISLKGTTSSHAAIFARSLGIPAIVDVTGLRLSQLHQQTAIIDGYYGKLYLSPSPAVKREFISLMREEHALNTELATLSDKPSITKDDYPIKLHVNTGLIEDISRALSTGAEGVGLYRSEIPFMARDSFPSEEDQRATYHQLLRAFCPKPVTLRTLDIGGDKPLPYFPVEEMNPSLGWRGIRMTLDHPEIFATQIRAMLRANHCLDNAKIMLPMISHISEIERALDLIEEEYLALKNELPDLTKPEIGVMIEVPATVYQASTIAKKVDFLSVGSNDLTQYILAADRTNNRLHQIYDGLHPAVLHALAHVVSAGFTLGVSVSLCGDLATDPLAVPLLIGMGFQTLSTNAAQLLRVKSIIRQFTLRETKQLWNEVMSMERAQDIRTHMSNVLDQAGLGGLIRAGK